MAAAKKNTITTELNQADTVTLSTSAGADVLKVLDDTTAADVVNNFKAGVGGDVIQIDTSALLAGAVQTMNTVALDGLQTRIATDADGTLVDADNAVLATDNILRITDTLADVTAMLAAIDLDAETNVAGLLNDEAILVLWTDGTNTHLSTATLNGADGADADAGADLIVLNGVAVTDLVNDNFVFI